MRIYIAAPYAARDYAKACAEELVQIGYEVTSSWLEETHKVNAGTVGAATALTDAEVNSHARMDLSDIESSNVFVMLTPTAIAGTDHASYWSGGRHVETGYAIAKGLHVVVVGDQENIFHRSDLVRTVCDWHTAVLHLAQCMVRHERDRVRAA